MAENLKFKERFSMRKEMAKLRQNKMTDYGLTIKDSHHPKISIDK